METLTIIANTLVDVIAHLVSPLANLGEFLGGFVELSEAGSSASSAVDAPEVPEVPEVPVTE